MRKISILLALLLLIVSCSEDESTTNESSDESQTLEFPSNISISSQIAQVGDILTINGNGFLINESYIITFEENSIGEIKEIKDSFIKVEVPENTKTGDILLTFNEKTEKIGNIQINIPFSSRLFTYKDGITPNQIVEIDKSTGNEIKVITDIDHQNYLSDFNFDSSTNEIICDYTDDQNIRFIYKINVNSGETKSIKSDPTTGRYENWIINRE